MRLTPSGKPTNASSFGVLGHLIIVNKQVHCLQLDILAEYLQKSGLDIGDTIIADIIDGKENFVSLTTSLVAFEREPQQIQKELYYVMVALSSVDNAIDENEQSYIKQILALSKIDEQDADCIRSTALEDAGEIRASQNHLFETPLPVPTPGKRNNMVLRIIHW